MLKKAVLAARRTSGGMLKKAFLAFFNIPLNGPVNFFQRHKLFGIQIQIIVMLQKGKNQLIKAHQRQRDAGPFGFITGC